MDYIAIVWLMLLSMAIFDGMHNVGDGTQIANGKFPTTVARLWTPRIIFRHSHKYHAGKHLSHPWWRPL